MANINFNDGFETFTINGDSNRVIKINPLLKYDIYPKARSLLS